MRLVTSVVDTPWVRFDSRDFALVQLLPQAPGEHYSNHQGWMCQESPRAAFSTMTIASTGPVQRLCLLASIASVQAVPQSTPITA